MSLLLQVSDPHFGTERAPVVEALVRLAHRLRPDWLLLSGDITQRATTAQFSAARAFVQRLQVPRVLALPGNHDLPLWNLPLRLLRPYARYSAAFGTDLEPEYEDEQLLLLALNTTRWWRHQDGQLSAAQVQRVSERLALSSQARPAQRRVVLVHQPLAVALAEDRPDLLHGHAEATEQWGRAGVDLVIGGHIHRPYVMALPHGGWVVQAGTAVSSRVRLEVGNSVNLIRIGRQPAERATVERWDHDAEQGEFLPREVHTLKPLSPHPAPAPAAAPGP